MNLIFRQEQLTDASDSNDSSKLARSLDCLRCAVGVVYDAAQSQ